MTTEAGSPERFFAALDHYLNPRPMTHDPVRRGVHAIWERAHAAILGHVSVLESAASSFGNGTLKNAERLNAGREARKLASASGTFGFWDAAALAREAETLLIGGDGLPPADVSKS